MPGLEAGEARGKGEGGPSSGADQSDPKCGQLRAKGAVEGTVGSRRSPGGASSGPGGQEGRR